MSCDPSCTVPLFKSRPAQPCLFTGGLCSTSMSITVEVTALTTNNNNGKTYLHLVCKLAEWIALNTANIYIYIYIYNQMPPLEPVTNCCSGMDSATRA